MDLCLILSDDYIDTWLEGGGLDRHWYIPQAIIKVSVTLQHKLLVLEDLEVFFYQTQGHSHHDKIDQWKLRMNW